MGRKQAYDYFDFFSAMIGCGCRIAEKLLDFLRDYDYPQLEARTRQLHAIENEADGLKHEMTEHLLTEFLPPIDLEDISNIAHKLDTVCDEVEAVLQTLFMNDVHVCRPDAVAMAQVIVDMCGNLKVCLSKFHNYRKDTSIRQHLVDINALEEQGDRLYLAAMRKLMTDGSGFRDMLVWREVYGGLESCCDAVEHVTDALEEVILKNT